MAVLWVLLLTRQSFLAKDYGKGTAIFCRLFNALLLPWELNKRSSKTSWLCFSLSFEAFPSFARNLCFLESSLMGCYFSSLWHIPKITSQEILFKILTHSSRRLSGPIVLGLWSGSAGACGGTRPLQDGSKRRKYWRSQTPLRVHRQ